MDEITLIDSSMKQKLNNRRKHMHKNIVIRVTRRDELKHSAKGSTWKDHKYIKKVGDK